jgi:hypothetical protein
MVWKLAVDWLAHVELMKRNPKLVVDKPGLPDWTPFLLTLPVEARTGRNMTAIVLCCPTATKPAWTAAVAMEEFSV